MLATLVPDTIVCLFVVLALAAAYSDVQDFTIPNLCSLSIAVSYVAFVLAANEPVAWLPAVGVAGIALFIGFVLFALKLIGGGDAKLFAAVALWAGPSEILSFTLLTALFGGLLAVTIWLQHRFAAGLLFGLSAGPAEPQNFAKKPIPYGVAISAGAVYVAFTLLR